MIYCTNQTKFKVFNVKTTEKTIRYRCGTSENRNGNYVNSYWDVVVFKDNHDIPVFVVGDTIVTDQFKIENPYDKKNERNWLSVVLIRAHKLEDAFC